MQTNSLYCLYKDKEDNVWIGTYFAGVAYTWDESITSIRRYYANSEGCDMGYYIREIVPDEDGNLWIGTESQGLTRLDQRLDNIVQIPIDENGNSCNIHGLCCDGDFVWVGTYEQTRSLVRIHRRTLASKSYPSAGKEIYTIAGHRAENYGSEPHPDSNATTVRQTGSSAIRRFGAMYITSGKIPPEISGRPPIPTDFTNTTP